jgi:hypothetical protein
LLLPKWTSQDEVDAQKSQIQLMNASDGYVSNAVERGALEREWHKLVMRLEGFLAWSDVPEDIKKSLLNQADKARVAALEDIDPARGGGGGFWDRPWIPAVPRSYLRLDFTTRALDAFESGIDRIMRGNSSLVAELLPDLRIVGEFGPRRWKDGKPLVGAPQAGEQTVLRLRRMRERLREEGSAEAVRDRRPLPDHVLLPGGHGRRYGRYSRRAPRIALLKAAVRAERERLRVMREAEWASLRLQGYGIGEIAQRAGVAASTVSETGAVRSATSLVETALAILSSETTNKAASARDLGIDPQRLQRAFRGVEQTPETGPEPPPGADSLDTRPWDLREQAHGLIEGPIPTLVDLVGGLEGHRAEWFGKLLQLCADADAGREPTRLFRREEAHVQQRPPEIPLRYFGGHRHRRRRR